MGLMLGRCQMCHFLIQIACKFSTVDSAAFSSSLHYGNSSLWAVQWSLRLKTWKIFFVVQLEAILQHNKPLGFLSLPLLRGGFP
jgi:hypothetical protein